MENIKLKRPLNILVFNCGSSSLSFKIFTIKELNDVKVCGEGKAHRIGVKGTEPSFIEYKFKESIQKDAVLVQTHQEAAIIMLNRIKNKNIHIDLVGHRFVHGGNYFKKPLFINKDTIRKLHLCLPLAPIHNPSAMSVIYVSKRILTRIRQYVTFDSAFHSTLPLVAYTYLLPKKIIQRFNYRKYGFHGLSYQYVSEKISEHMNVPLKKLNMVICHLGTGGSSVVAIKSGVSVDTSMGYSPLTGLTMSTRCGDIDPMLAIYLMVAYDYRPDALMDSLEKKSGLLGISGFSSDIRDIVKQMNIKERGKQAKLAFDMYIHRLKEYIGSYVAVLGGINVLAFTDDMGVRNSLVRERVCENMSWCGVLLNKYRNRIAKFDKIEKISFAKSAVKIFSVPTDEEKIICQEGLRLLNKRK